MNGKRFALLSLGTAALLTALLTLLVVAVDPFFHLRLPEKAVFESERYENPGIIRHSEFDTIIMGTSLVCNFRASWFDGLTGGQTLKIGFRDGYLSDFNAALQLAFDTEPDVRTVYFGLDANILSRQDAQRTTDLPQYLYDDDPFNDVSYYLNKDVYLRCLSALLERAKGNAVPLDEAHVWSGEAYFDAWQALASYERPTVSDTVLESGVFHPAADENIAVIDSWASAHPDTEFHLFISPYSILYWDRMERMGRMEAVLGMLDYAIPRLLEYDNVTVHFFMDCEAIITDMDNYTDHIHFSDEIGRQLTEWLVTEEYAVTADDYRARLDRLEDIVRNYDYDALLAPYGK